MRSACACSIARRRVSLQRPYGDALLARGRAAFDELRQGIRDIEFIADPEAGELRIGCPELIAAGFLVRVLERFSSEHPRVRFHVVPVFQPTVEFPELLERKIDLVFARLTKDPVRGRLTEELNAEVLFRDRYTLVVGENNKLARRRRVTLAELVDEPWIMTPLDALGDLFWRVHSRRVDLRRPPSSSRRSRFICATISLAMENSSPRCRTRCYVSTASPTLSRNYRLNCRYGLRSRL